MTKHESKELLKAEDLIITAWESGSMGRFTISSMSSNMLRGVKIYHKPTGIEVTEDSERSQHKNKDIAINRLREKLQTVHKHDSKTADELVVENAPKWADGHKTHEAYPNSPCYIESADLVRSLADIKELVELRKKNAELEKERDEYHAMVVYTGFIMEQSEGVAGYHLNGDIADWDSLFTEPLYKELLAKRDLEQQAKGIADALSVDGSWDLNPKDRVTYIKHHKNMLKLKAKQLKEQGNE